MVFQIVSDSNLAEEFKLQVVKIGDPSKKKAPPKLPTEEESKVPQSDNCEISSDGCQIQDDEMEK